MQITTYEDALEVLEFFEFAAPALTNALKRDRRERAAILSKQAATQHENDQLRKRMVDITPDISDVSNPLNQPDAVAAAIAAKRLEQVNEPTPEEFEEVPVEAPVNVAEEVKDVEPEKATEEETKAESKEEAPNPEPPKAETPKTASEKARRDGSDGKQPFTPFKVSTTKPKS